MKTVVFALVASLMLTAVSVPAARADELRIQVIDGAKDRSPAYVDFFGIFTATLIDELDGLRKSGWQNPSPEHWVILLSPILSPTGNVLVTVIAIRDGEPKSLPILIAVLNERSDAAVIRTAAKSTQRVVVESATKPQDQPPPPAQKLKTNNPRTKQRAGVFISILRMWYRTNYE